MARVAGEPGARSDVAEIRTVAEGGGPGVDHRDRPRVGSRDGVRADLDHLSPRGSGTRSLISLALGGAILGVLAVVGYRVVSQASGWLQQQPDYQVAFSSIELEEPPPRWFKGGKAAFLEQVRKAAGLPRAISRLTTTPDQLLAAFREAPWVLEASRVVFDQDRIKVALRYRQPVAYVQLDRGEQRLVDAAGNVLQPEDVDPEPLDPLIRIIGTGLKPPADARTGVVWKTLSTGVLEPDRRIVAAAKTAGFLAAARKSTSKLAIESIIVSDFDRRGLFLQTDLGILVWWRSAPGSEKGTEPLASEKWVVLEEWAATRKPVPIPPLDYMAFSGKALVQVCPHEGRPHRGLSSSSPRDDGDRP